MLSLLFLLIQPALAQTLDAPKAESATVQLATPVLPTSVNQAVIASPVLATPVLTPTPPSSPPADSGKKEIPSVSIPVNPPTAAPDSVAPDAVDEGEYEIDYEEEPDTEGDAAPVPTPKKRGRNLKDKTNSKVAESARPQSKGGGPAVQGSRAKHRFTPILKSETKSIYRKEGKTLDVDAD